MPPNPLLSLRATVPDGTILDLMHLLEVFPTMPTKIKTAYLQNAWSCNQCTVSRRMTSLWDANLIEYRTGRGEYLVRRLGPVAA
jgi:hypothetical protein